MNKNKIKNLERIIFNNNKIKFDIWENNSVALDDYKKLNKTIKNFNNYVCNYLYNYHEKKISKENFKKFIFIWSSCYVQSYFYKWKRIEKILKKKKNYYYLNSYNFQIRDFIFLDTLEYIKQLQYSKEYNYLNYQRVINYFVTHLGYRNVKINQKKNYLKNSFKYYLKDNFFFLIVKKFFNYFYRFVELFFFRKKILFVDRINNSFFCHLNLRFKQIPIPLICIFNWNFFIKKIQNSKNINKKIVNRFKKRNLIIKRKNNKKSFYQFLLNNFIKDIPIIFIEKFNFLNNLAKNINIKPKKVISFYSHYYNELFKLWIISYYKKDFFISSHGGNHHKIVPYYNYNQLVSKKYISWLRKENNSVQLPIPKYYQFKKSFKFRNTKRKNLILYAVKHEIPFMARISPGDTSLKKQYTFKYCKIIFKNLKPEIRKNFLVCPKRKLNFSELQKIDNKNLLKKIGKPLDFYKNYKNSKLNICTYPITTFIDSLLVTPTILIFDKSQWPIYSRFKKIYNELEKSNIVFTDPQKATYHINNVYDNINEWWYLDEVQNAKNNFLLNFNIDSKNCISDWKNFLKV